MSARQNASKRRLNRNRMEILKIRLDKALKRAKDAVFKQIEGFDGEELSECTWDDYPYMILEYLTMEDEYLYDEERPSVAYLNEYLDYKEFDDHIEECQDNLRAYEDWEETKRSLNRWIHTG